MASLVEVVLQLASARSLTAVQDIVRHAARRLGEADGATFILRDGDQCHYADEDAIQPLWKGRRFPMSACVSGWAMLNRQSVAIEDIYADPRVPHAAYRPTFVRSMVMVPIRTERPLGAIGVYWARSRRADDAEVHALQALADSTAVAIENITLLEELRAAKDTAERADRLKSEFLGVLSHELRTPMTPILGWSSLLCEGPASPTEVAEAAQAIHSCAASHLAQIDDLLDLGQMLAGTLRLHATPADLDQVADAAIEQARPAAAAKGVALVREPTDGAHPITADVARLQHAVGHLLANAIKFTPSGGAVRVELQRDATHVRAIVRDDGTGITPEFAPFVFDHFRQADSGLTRATGGMGIGLAVVRQLMALHGGTVTAASDGKGKGSTFTIALPQAGSTPA